MSGTVVNISSNEIDSKIGRTKHYIDVWVHNKKVARRESVDEIRIKHLTLPNYLSLLSKIHGTNELNVDILKATGNSFKITERVQVTVENPITILAEPLIDAAIPAIATQSETIKPQMENKMTDTQASFYALQNELLRGHYETLKKDYDILKQKFDKHDDDLREAKTKIHSNDADKKYAVLNGVAEVRNSGMDFMKDILKAENASGIADMIRAVKGSGESSNTTPSIFKGMTATQKESLSAIADMLKLQSPEETEAMVGVTLIASNDNTKSWFQRVKTEVENELSQLTQ